jgi:transposase
MKQVRKFMTELSKAVQLSYDRHNISELARELGVTAPQKLYKSMKSSDKEVFLERQFKTNARTGTNYRT